MAKNPIRFRFARPLIMAVLASLITLIVSGCGAGKEDPAERPSLTKGVVARINGETVPASDLDLRTAVLSLYLQQDITGEEQRRQLLDQLITQRLLAMDAARQGLKVDPKRQTDELEQLMSGLLERYGTQEALDQRMSELKLTRPQLQAWLNEFLLAGKAVETVSAQVTVSDEELRQAYDERKDTAYSFQENVVRARHILVPKAEAEKARQLLTQAKSGADFATLAQENSIDTGSAAVGGDLGYFVHGDMVKEFADVAFSLQAGEIGGPVESEYGWHIIQVDDRRGPGTVPFAEAKSDVQNKLLPGKQNEAVGKYIEGLRTAAKVELADAP